MSLLYLRVYPNASVGVYIVHQVKEISQIGYQAGLMGSTYCTKKMLSVCFEDEFCCFIATAGLVDAYMLPFNKRKFVISSFVDKIGSVV